MISREQLQAFSDRYRAERPRYAQFVEIAREVAENACLARGLKCVVSGRAKEHASFVKKMMKAPQPYEQVYDKAGIRIVPVYPDDRPEVAKLVNDIFVVSWQEDYDAAATGSQFGYRGYHFTIGLRDADKGDHPAIATSVTGELQIHTPGAHLWANVNHDLVYKTWADIDLPTKRAFSRLSAILELVDMSMGDLRRAVLGGPAGDLARTCEAIEKDHMRFSGQPFDTAMTREIVGALAPLLGTFDEFIAGYRPFVAAKEEKISYVLQSFGDAAREVLLTQPESLLIFFLLERHMGPELADRWPESIPVDALEAIESRWIA